MMPSRALFYAIVVTPGAVLMALEIVSSRVLAPHFGNSVYVWGSIIGVFLAAMAIGYFWGGRLADRHPRLAVVGRLILAAALAQVPVMLAGEPIVAALGRWSSGSPAGTLLAVALLFGPATVFLAMVSPYAVKLATRHLGHLGDTTGKLYALSTGGSLGGTLGATFLLIPHLGLDTILRLLLATSVVAGIAALATAWRGERLFLALAASLMLLALLPRQRATDGGLEVLAERLTPYQTLRVIESDGVRFLHSDGTVHAAIETATGEPWLSYPRHAAAALLIEPEIERLLVLGMGGGSAGSYLQRRLPALRVDYVDIDPAVPELARALMHFEENERTAVYVDDGRRFLAGRPGARWDYVYVDTYIGSAIPFHLSTIEFFRLVKDHLAPGGVLGLNMVAAPENAFARGILRGLASVFHRTYVFNVPGGNDLYLATDRSPAPDPGELLAAGRRLDRRYDFDPSLTRLAELLRRQDLDLTEAPLLTDRFAPVNHLIRVDQAKATDFSDRSIR